MLTNIVPYIVATGWIPMIFILAIVYLFVKNKMERTRSLVSNFEKDRVILEYNMNKAYALIHKDDIFIYSLEATKLSESEFDRSTKKFVKLVEKMIGPRLLKHYIFLYGNYDTFVFNLVEYFNTRYEDDEIREAAQQDLMENEVETGETKQ